MNAGGGKVAIVSVGELYLVNAGGGKACYCLSRITLSCEC